MRRRILAILLTTLCSFSLLLATLALAAWMVHTLRADTWTYTRTSPAPDPGMMNIDTWEFDLAGGYLALWMHQDENVSAPINNNGRITHDYRPLAPPRFWLAGSPGVTTLRSLPYCEFDLVGFADGQHDGQCFIRLPLLGLAALFAIPPLIWELNHRHRARRFAQSQKGLCRTCGYDLRESPERCPECGARTPRNWSLIDRLLHAPVTRRQR